MTVADWLHDSEEKLIKSDCPDPQIDGKWILEDTLGLNHTELFFSMKREISRDEADKLNARLLRRINGEPVQYILRTAAFMGQNFYVDERVLIPRQDTETLVEAAVIALKARRKPTVLDLCTGSGAIGLSVKTLLPSCEVTLTDISKDALEVAKKNSELLNAPATLRHGNLFNAVEKERFDCILSNPPYIPADEIAELQKEVQKEPIIALDGGADGLDFYRKIAAEVKNHLNPSGLIFMEVGINQAEPVLGMLTQNMDCAQSGAINDLNGIPRVVWAAAKS